MGEVEIMGAGILDQLGHAQRDSDLPDRTIEMEPEEAIDEEDR